MYGHCRGVVDQGYTAFCRDEPGYVPFVEQRVVYSIYYNGTLVLPLERGEGSGFSWLCLGESGVRTRDVIILAYGSTSLYTVLSIMCHNYTA